MKHFISSLIIVTAAAIAHADLAGDVNAAISSKVAARGQIGVQIAHLGGGGDSSAVVFASNASLPLVPASNLKLLTTSAALQILGGDFRFSTTLAQRGDSLIVIGDGDPTLGDAELLKTRGWTTTTLFEQWADLLKSRGITRVGDVIVDDSVFDDQFVNHDWPADQLHKRYVAQVSGLNLNGNCVDFYLAPGKRGEAVTYRNDPPTKYITVDNQCRFADRNAVYLSRAIGGNQVILKGETNAANDDPIAVTVHDPAIFFATVMSETLQSRGVQVTGKIRRDNAAHTWTDAVPLARHETPLEIVIHRANKDSVNLYAECLAKRIAARAAGGHGGSWAGATTLLAEFLTKLGVSGDEFALSDGCGLSKSNRISANALCQILIADFFGPNRDVFMQTLAVGGVDGTLDSRFRDDLKGRVFAKTGYISNARCLSGFVVTKKKNWYAFSILINGPVGSEGRRIQEQIVAAIDRND